MTLIEFHEFLLLYGKELTLLSASTVCICVVFIKWIDWREKQISKNWKEYVNANS